MHDWDVANMTAEELERTYGGGFFYYDKGERHDPSVSRLRPMKFNSQVNSTSCSILVVFVFASPFSAALVCFPQQRYYS